MYSGPVTRLGAVNLVKGQTDLQTVPYTD